MEFKYTKANGDVSERALIVTQEPVKLLAGIDVTELPEAQFAEFTNEYRKIKDRQHQEMLELQAKYDLTHNYRQFTPERMSEVVTEWV